MLKRTLIAASLLSLSLQALTGCGRKPEPVASKPVLDVVVATPQPARLATLMPAFGAIAPWQEISLGAEVGGMRLMELLVEVGDTVKKGQVIARFNTEALGAEIDAQKASLAEAEATAANASAQADRAKKLREVDGLSEQDMQQAQTTEKTAQARVALMKAQLTSLTLKLGYAELRAPYDGVISARSGIPGQVVSAGAELVKLIRQGRLEWRAELNAEQLATVKPGQSAQIHTSRGDVVGTVRKVAPSVDANTRTGIVYVDLPAGVHSPAGAYVSGELRGPAGPALTLPASAILLKDGKQLVATVSTENKVQFVPVSARPAGDDKSRVEGVAADTRVVQAGAVFLSAGDLVQVVLEGGGK